MFLTYRAGRKLRNFRLTFAAKDSGVTLRT
jgi:hypothetical protein